MFEPMAFPGSANGAAYEHGFSFQGGGWLELANTGNNQASGDLEARLQQFIFIQMFIFKNKVPQLVMDGFSHHFPKSSWHLSL